MDSAAVPPQVIGREEKTCSVAQTIFPAQGRLSTQASTGHSESQQNSRCLMWSRKSSCSVLTSCLNIRWNIPSPVAGAWRACHWVPVLRLFAIHQKVKSAKLHPSDVDAILKVNVVYCGTIGVAQLLCFCTIFSLHLDLITLSKVSSWAAACSLSVLYLCKPTQISGWMSSVAVGILTRRQLGCLSHQWSTRQTHYAFNLLEPSPSQDGSDRIYLSKLHRQLAPSPTIQDRSKTDQERCYMKNLILKLVEDIVPSNCVDDFQALSSEDHSGTNGSNMSSDVACLQVFSSDQRRRSQMWCYVRGQKDSKVDWSFFLKLYALHIVIWMQELDFNQWILTVFLGWNQDDKPVLVAAVLCIVVFFFKMMYLTWRDWSKQPTTLQSPFELNTTFPLSRLEAVQDMDVGMWLMLLTNHVLKQDDQHPGAFQRAMDDLRDRSSQEVVSEA